jgi:hypothetical protein
MISSSSTSGIAETEIRRVKRCTNASLHIGLGGSDPVLDGPMEFQLERTQIVPTSIPMYVSPLKIASAQALAQLFQVCDHRL